MEEQQSEMNDMNDMNDMNEQVEQQNESAWAIVELFGHQMLAGAISKTERFGAVMLRIDVPASGRAPGFTREYSPSALFSITYASEEVVRLTARQLASKPINVYVPELDDYGRLLAENKKLKQVVNDLTVGALPEPVTARSRRASFESDTEG